MKIFNFFAILIIGIAFLSGCNTKSKAVQTAEMMCDCGTKVLDFRKKYEAAPDSLRAGMGEELKRKISELNSCTGGQESIKKIEDGLTKEEKEKFIEEFRVAMEKTCPEVAEQMFK